MTIDDENSIYVGGLPSDATEDSLHRAFDLYGAIVNIKLINDREIGGKCYGFVTFTNPRSATNAISDMNGRTIGGRVVRVNEVRTRGVRPTLRHENFRRVAGRDFDRDRDREERDRDRERDNDWHRDRNVDHSRDHDRDRERDHVRGYDSDRARDRAFDRGRDQDDRDHEHTMVRDKNWERDHNMDLDRDRDIDYLENHDGGGDKDKEQQPRNKLSDRRSRKLSSNSSGGYHNQAKEQLELSIHRHDELHKEIIQIQETIEEKELLVSNLNQKFQKLDAAVAETKKVSSQRKLMLAELHRCFLQAKDHSQRLKSYEHELQLLADRATDE